MATPARPPGLLSRLTFSWVTPLLDIGRTRQLSAGDLPPLPRSLHPEACLAALWRHRRRHGSLLWAICRAYGGRYINLGLLKVGRERGVERKARFKRLRPPPPGV